MYLLTNPLDYMFQEEMDFTMYILINPQLYVFKSIMWLNWSMNNYFCLAFAPNRVGLSLSLCYLLIGLVSAIYWWKETNGITLMGLLSVPDRVTLFP